MRKHTKTLAALGVVICLTAGLAYGRVYERLQALFANGTAAAPSLSFVSDPDTGVYRASANTPAISAGGTAAATFAVGTTALKGTAVTNSITSDTTATAATSSVAALTFAPTATLGANDLVAEVNSAAGTSLYSVDLEGDTVTAGDIAFAGGNLNSTVTGAAAIATSDTTAVAMTASVPAWRLLASATPDANDMLFEVMYGTTSVFSVDKEGDLTFAGSATFSPADLTLSGGDLTSSKADQSLNFVADTNAATATASIAPFVFAPSATLDANDLVCNFKAVVAGSSVFSVDLEGDGVLAGDLALAGNGLTCSGTGATCLLSSGANDGLTSTTVAATTIKSTVNVTDGDLVFVVSNSADDLLVKVSEQGAVTGLTTITATTGLLTPGNALTCSGAAATCAWTSDINDATATSSVAAFTLAPSVDLTAGDLLVEVNDSGGTAQFSLNEQGDGVFTGLVSSVAAATCADSGDGNPGTLTLEANGNVIPLTCSDANGCTITMAETNVANGTLVTIVNVSANTANFADTSGVTELTGAVALGQYDSLQLVYSVDRWVMVSTSNN